jgi:protein-L-isoaspartate(D-aspartate) O-methyltransferase
MNKTHKDLIEELVNKGVIKSKEVAQAMLLVDRKFYTQNNPYTDSPQRIGYGATISAPHMHAYAL